MITKPFTASAFPAALVMRNMQSAINRDTENAGDAMALKLHELRDVTCMIEQTNVVLDGLINYITPDAQVGGPLLIPDQEFIQSLDYLFLDLSGRCARADKTQDYIQTIYGSQDNDERRHYESPAEGAFQNFRGCLGHYLDGDCGTAFARLLLGMRYMYDVEGFDSTSLAPYFNEPVDDGVPA